MLFRLSGEKRRENPIFRHRGRRYVPVYTASDGDGGGGVQGWLVESPELAPVSPGGWDLWATSIVTISSGWIFSNINKRSPAKCST